MEAGHIKKQPLSALMFGAITEAALSIAEAKDINEARTQAKIVIEPMLRSF